MTEPLNKPQPLMMIASEDVPWVQVTPQMDWRLIYATEAGFVLHSRLAPGFRTTAHRHHGDVHVFTYSGAWMYTEHEEIMKGGSYLYEPDQSTHTLYVLDENEGPTEMCVVASGVLEYLNGDGSRAHTSDPRSLTERYLTACDEHGVPRPPHLQQFLDDCKPAA